MWAELLYGARTAGVPVQAWLLQIWEMGAGKLPLDAIRRGTITKLEWHEKIEKDEWKMLLDALVQNTSLEEINLGGCKLTDEQLQGLVRVLEKGALPECIYIYVDDNPASEEAQQAVKDALKQR